MGDQDFNGIALAIQTQGAFGTVDPECKALSGALVVGDGIILGDKNSGTAETGITLPTHTAKVREAVQVASSYTQGADDFLKELVEGLAITFPLKGNGATSTPASDEAQPDAGIDNLWGTAGLVGASGAATPDYKYTPRASAEYSTVHLWVADLDFILMDCLVELASIKLTTGEAALITANIKVGSLESHNDGVTFPTFTWGTQSSLAAPVVAGVAFAAFGQTRGFEGDLTINIANGIEEFGDSNVAITGVRQAQTNRIITVDGRLYQNDSDSLAEHDALIDTSAPTAALSLQLGTAAGAGGGETLNAALINVNNLQMTSMNYGRTGDAATVEMSGAKATSTTAGTEFMLEYN
jgi:hypothetical protein